jgi:archaetidylinositol phosphate synthase
MNDIERLNDSALQALEVPVLGWFVRHLPKWVKSDHLTLLGLFGAALTFLGYLLSAWMPVFLWLASFGLAINWFGDSLDGTLARHRMMQRARYGFFVDHSTDLFAQILIGLGLAMSGFVRFEAASFALVAYLAALVVALLRERIQGVLKITIIRIGPTEVRCGLIAMNTLFFSYVPKPVMSLFGSPVSLVDIALMAGSIVTLLVLAFSVLRVARSLN